MFTFLLVSRRSLATALTTIICLDIVVGSILLAANLSDGNIFPKGVRFGFYRTDETKG